MAFSSIAYPDEVTIFGQICRGGHQRKQRNWWTSDQGGTHAWIFLGQSCDGWDWSRAKPYAGIFDGSVYGYNKNSYEPKAIAIIVLTYVSVNFLSFTINLFIPNYRWKALIQWKRLTIYQLKISIQNLVWIF